jgi:Holliday junction resolvase RusA-like endonuclease
MGGDKDPTKSNVVRFTVPMDPIPLGRPRLSRYKVYDPQVLLKRQVALFLRPQWNMIPLDGNISLEIIFYFHIPDSWSAKKKEKVAGKRKGGRPDLSNCIKFYEDVMQDIGVYKDDAQIVEISAQKLYDDGNGARVIIALKELNET